MCYYIISKSFVLKILGWQLNLFENITLTILGLINIIRRNKLTGEVRVKVRLKKSFIGSLLKELFSQQNHGVDAVRCCSLSLREGKAPIYLRAAALNLLTALGRIDVTIVQ